MRFPSPLAPLAASARIFAHFLALTLITTRLNLFAATGFPQLEEFQVWNTG
jgi:hypothetical protein